MMVKMTGLFCNFRSNIQLGLTFACSTPTTVITGHLGSGVPMLLLRSTLGSDTGEYSAANGYPTQAARRFRVETRNQSDDALLPLAPSPLVTVSRGCRLVSVMLAVT